MYLMPYISLLFVFEFLEINVQIFLYFRQLNATTFPFSVMTYTKLIVHLYGAKLLELF
jgi:hypothetical protein